MNSGCQEGFSVNNLFPTLLLNSIRTEKIYRNFSFLLFFCYAHYYCVRLWEAVAHRYFLKKVLLKIAKNFQKNSYARDLQLYFKKRLWHRCFPVNFAKFLRTTFFRRTSLVAASRLIASSFYSYGKLWLLTVEISFFILNWAVTRASVSQPYVIFIQKDIYPYIEHIYPYIEFRVVILSLVLILSLGRIFGFVLNETTSNFQLQIAI